MEGPPLGNLEQIVDRPITNEEFISRLDRLTKESLMYKKFVIESQNRQNQQIQNRDDQVQRDREIELLVKNFVVIFLTVSIHLILLLEFFSITKGLRDSDFYVGTENFLLIVKLLLMGAIITVSLINFPLWCLERDGKYFQNTGLIHLILTGLLFGWENLALLLFPQYSGEIYFLDFSMAITNQLYYLKTNLLGR